MKLKKFYKVIVTKYNFGDVCLNFSVGFPNEPGEEDVIKAIEDCNTKNPITEGFATTAKIELTYMVDRSQ